MIDILCGNGLFPGVTAGIEQIQAATRIVESDARTAAILRGLGIIGIVAVEDKGVALLDQTDVDAGRGIAVHAVFEGILYQ